MIAQCVALCLRDEMEATPPFVAILHWEVWKLSRTFVKLATVFRFNAGNLREKNVRFPLECAKTFAFWFAFHGLLVAVVSIVLRSACLASHPCLRAGMRM